MADPDHSALVRSRIVNALTNEEMTPLDIVVVLASAWEVSILSASLSAAFGSRGGGVAARALGRGDVLRA
jgi:hypothetical protein